MGTQLVLKALGIATLFLSLSAAPIASGSAWVEVTGVGQLNVMPDKARLQGRAVSLAATPTEAKRDVDDVVALVLATFEQEQIERKAYGAGQLTLGPRYQMINGQRERVGYEARRQVSLEVDVDNVGLWLQRLTELGLKELDSPQYFAQGYQQRREQLLRLAVADAKAKASILAESNDRRLGAVLEIVEVGQVRPMPRMAVMAEADGGRYAPAEQGEQLSFQFKFELVEPMPNP